MAAIKAAVQARFDALKENRQRILLICPGAFLTIVRAGIRRNPKTELLVAVDTTANGETVSVRLPLGTFCTSAYFDQGRGCFGVYCFHESFDAIAPGDLLPTMVAHLVETDPETGKSTTIIDSLSPNFYDEMLNISSEGAPVPMLEASPEEVQAALARQEVDLWLDTSVFPPRLMPGISIGQPCETPPLTDSANAELVRDNECTCLMSTLMIAGCRCGSLNRN